MARGRESFCDEHRPGRREFSAAGRSTPNRSHSGSVLRLAPKALELLTLSDQPWYNR